MGRLKLPIKKIENPTNRQITYSKRGSGLTKKAYELSVLCEVDVALIMFSPMGKLEIFSGNNKSMDEIIRRYLNIPDSYEVRRQKNLECLCCLRGALDVKMRADKANKYQPSPSLRPAMSESDVQVEELQREIVSCNNQLEALEKRLRIFEGDPSEIITLSEAQHCDYILEKTLKRVSLRKRTLEKQNVHLHNANVISNQVDLPLNNASSPGKETSVGTLKDWLSLKSDTNDLVNSLDANILPPLSLNNPLLEPFPLFYWQNPQQDDGTCSSNTGQKDDECGHAPQFRTNMKSNTPVSPQFYPTGNETMELESEEITAKTILFNQLFG